MHLFKRTREVEGWIDELLNTVSESALLVRESIFLYLQGDAGERFRQRLDEMTSYETRANELRREVEQYLYRETLIPDARRDVLQLLEALNDIIDRHTSVLWYFTIEKPDIPDAMKDDYRELSEMTAEAVESLVLASRAYFRDPEAVNDHLHKVRYYESQADERVRQLRQRIFDTDLGLANKIHLRFFAERIVWISDLAEDIADQLIIFSIKRSV